MCEAQESKFETDYSRDIFSSYSFKSSFAKSMVHELTDKQPPAVFGNVKSEFGVPPSIPCSGVKNYQENKRFSSRTSAIVCSLDRNSIRTRTEYTGKYYLSDRAADLGKVDTCAQEHRQSEQQLQQEEFKFVMEESSPPQSGNHLRLIDTVILQSRVETLQWQLKQAEESRQMYRSLMEHVMKFLERVYTNLDEISRAEQCKSLPTSKCNSPSHRVPRSQSALSVHASPARSTARSNRETVVNVSRAKSTAQIEESPSTFCDYTWRRSPKVTQKGEVTIQKLSQEAYRLLRTVQSLLNTNEPNLTQSPSYNDSCSENQRTSSRNDDSFARLSPDTESLQQSLQDLSLSRISPHGTSVERSAKRNCNDPDAVMTGSFSSLRREHVRRRVPLNSMLTLPKDPHPDLGVDSLDACLPSPHYTASLGRPKKLKESKLVISRPEECYISDSRSEKQLSLSSNEDESGFSSMSSFQEVGLPLVPASSTPSPENVPSYPQVGVPVFETGDCATNHRRWSSVPIESRPHSQLGPVIPESVTVMWV